jgi:hypothetical protein
MKRKTNLQSTIAIPLLLAVWLWAGESSAISIRGYMASSCGEWVEQSKKQSLDISKAAFEAAVLAYLSGLASGKQKDFLTDTDWASTRLWIDNYCAANPLDKLWVAAEKLASELMRRKGIR